MTVEVPGVVFDIEANGLDPTKIHCLGVNSGDGPFSTADYDEMRNWFEDQEIIVGHYIRGYDIPVVEKLLGIKIRAKIVDTWALACALEPNRPSYGLADYGEEFGVAKPKVDDWDDQPLEVYLHRVEQDTVINWKLWERLWGILLKLYEGDIEKIWEYLDYLDFKMYCASLQAKSKWKIDLELAQSTLDKLEKLREEKIQELEAVMPEVPIITTRSYPAKPLKKDGTLSSHGQRWQELLLEKGLPRTYKEDIEVVTGYEPPNSGSHTQIKNWLYSLGWKPATFKYKRDKKTFQLKSIPQINKEHGAGICESIKRLYQKEPRLEVLDGLSVLNHRIPILRGFINGVDSDGFVKAEVQGLTNTLRFQHKTVVNLPKVGKPYGEEIRGCLTVLKGKILCGSDMASLEDRLKQHFMYEFDPEYVERVNRPDYDPHIALAVMGEMMTEQQGIDYVNGDKQYKPIRDIAKNGNYSCQYGAGPPRIAITAGIPLSQAKIVHKAYWDLNWAIKAVAEVQTYKELDGQMWLLNPINGFWYSLREIKDIFSTLVQGTASYVFDLWIGYVLQEREELTAQFHDEGVWTLDDNEKEKESFKKILTDAIQAANDYLKLNRELGIDIQYGYNYASIH